MSKRVAMRVARSFIPGNCCAVHKTVKETFMSHAKSHGTPGGAEGDGAGVLSNYNAYQRWVRTAHAHSQHVNTTLNMAGMLVDNLSEINHPDVCPSEIHKDEIGTRTS